MGSPLLRFFSERITKCCLFVNIAIPVTKSSPLNFAYSQPLTAKKIFHGSFSTFRVLWSGRLIRVCLTRTSHFSFLEENAPCARSIRPEERWVRIFNLP
jgi:hypothetical protein